MGSVSFNAKAKTVETVEGQPFHVYGVEEIKTSIDSRTRDVNIKRMFRAMKIAVPPEGMVIAYAGQTGLKAMIQSVFGSGQRGSTTMFWWPTATIVDGYRAWVRHQQWTEGGGDNWIGKPIEHDWIVAGAWIAEIPFRAFAKELFTEHPLGKLLWKEMERDAWEFPVWRVYAPIGSSPREWSGVNILDEGFTFMEKEKDEWRLKGNSAGVYRCYKVQFSLWQGEILVHEPDYWQMKTVAHKPLAYMQARNGKATLLFERPNCSPEFGWKEEEKQIPAYSAELPYLPEYRLPANVSGDYATFWESKEAYKAFCRKWNIEAEKPFMGIHDPNEDEPWGLMIPMKEGWAELAWREGARKIPPVTAEVPDDFLSWRRNPKSSYDSDRIIPEGLTPLNGFCAYIYAQPGEFAISHIMADRNNFHGWLRMPRGLAFSHGCSVREDGDVVDEREHELIVYTPSGRVHLPK